MCAIKKELYLYIEFKKQQIMTSISKLNQLNDYLQNVLNHKESPNLDNAIELLNDFCLDTFNLDFHSLESKFKDINFQKLSETKKLIDNYFAD